LIAQQRDERGAAPAPRPRYFSYGRRRGRFVLTVWNLDNFTAANRFTPGKRGEWLRVVCPEGGIGGRTDLCVSHHVQRIVHQAEHRSRRAIDQLVRALGDGIEDRLHVGGRACDHLQDVGGGGLPLQRLLRFVEQPRVL